MKRLLPALALLLAGCATHQVRFQPMQGVPAGEQAALQRGEFSVAPDKLIDAATTTLEHEPYLHWQISTLDKANGLVKADAGLLREVQLRVTSMEGGGSRLAISVPRRELKTRAKIYIKKADPSELTAYQPEAGHLPDYKVLSADVALDDEYFYSFTWRVLHDRSQVPFRLQSYQGPPSASPSASSGQAQPASIPTPAPAPATTPVAVDEGPRLPVRADPSAAPGQAPLPTLMPTAAP